MQGQDYARHAGGGIQGGARIRAGPTWRQSGLRRELPEFFRVGLGDEGHVMFADDAFGMAEGRGDFFSRAGVRQPHAGGGVAGAVRRPAFEL